LSDKIEYSDANYNRGRSKYKLGNIDGACLNWEKAVELGDKDAIIMISNYCK